MVAPLPGGQKPTSKKCSIASNQRSIGGYTFEAGIVAVSFVAEGREFLVSRHSMLENISEETNTSKDVPKILPLGDAAVSPPELFCLSKAKDRR